MLVGWMVSDIDMFKEPLSKKIKNRQVIAFDLYGKKHKRWLKNFKFRPSVYGVLIDRGRVLVQRHKLLSKYGFPGGGVKIGESILEGLIREYEEESGVRVRASKLLGINEDFFTFKGTDIHGVLIYYEVKKIGGKILPNGNGNDTGEVKFVNIDELTKKTTSRSQWEFINIFKSRFQS